MGYRRTGKLALFDCSIFPGTRTFRVKSPTSPQEVGVADVDEVEVALRVEITKVEDTVVLYADDTMGTLEVCEAGVSVQLVVKPVIGG